MTRRILKQSYVISGAWIEPSPRSNSEGSLYAPFRIRVGRVVVRPHSGRLDDYDRLHDGDGHVQTVGSGSTRDDAEHRLMKRAERLGWISIGCNMYALLNDPVYRHGSETTCELPLADKALERYASRLVGFSFKAKEHRQDVRRQSRKLDLLADRQLEVARSIAMLGADITFDEIRGGGAS